MAPRIRLLRSHPFHSSIGPVFHSPAARPKSYRFSNERMITHKHTHKHSINERKNMKLQASLFTLTGPTKCGNVRRELLTFGRQKPPNVCGGSITRIDRSCVEMCWKKKAKCVNNWTHSRRLTRHSKTTSDGSYIWFPLACSPKCI